MRAGRAGWRAVIGRIKAGAFEDNANRLIDFMERRNAAFRADRQRIICKFLGLLELNAAVFAPICINRHTSHLIFPRNRFGRIAV